MAHPDLSVNRALQSPSDWNDKLRLRSGEHTVEVLKELGLEKQLPGLLESGVVAASAVQTKL